MWSSVSVLTTAAMTPGLRPPSRIKTRWDWAETVGWPASDGEPAIGDQPFGPWHATQVWTTDLMPAGGSWAPATDGRARAVIAANRKRALANPVILSEAKDLMAIAK